jgi:hypothetical protein
MAAFASILISGCDERGLQQPTQPESGPSMQLASGNVLVRTSKGTELHSASNMVQNGADFLRGASALSVLPTGPSFSMSASALSPVAWVAAGQTRLFRRNPDRLDIICGVRGPAPDGFGGFTVYMQNTISDPVAHREEMCSMSDGTSFFNGRAGSAGGARVELGTHNWIEADGILLEDFASITRQDGTAYQDVLTFDPRSRPSILELAVSLDGRIWNQFTPESPAFAQAAVSAAALALVLPTRSLGFAGKINVNWLDLDSIPGTHFEGIFRPAPLFTLGYDTVSASIDGTVIFRVPLTSADPLPFTINLYTAEFYYSLVPDPIRAYGRIHADFYNTLYLQGVKVLDAEGNDITAEAAPALSSGLPIKQSQTIVFTPSLAATATVGSSVTLSASGGASGNPVTFSSLTPSICSVSGATLHVIAIGTCVVAANQAGNSSYMDASQVTSTTSAIWPFRGFLPPIDGSAVNAVQAGSSVPLKFSLGGDRGLNVLEPGSPASSEVPCDGSNAVSENQIRSVSANRLSYDAATSQYSYVWKTDKSSAGTCRLLTLILNDGTSHTALFSFTR